MLQFEKDVIELLEAKNIEYTFNSNSHLISTDLLNIQFIPNCNRNSESQVYNNLSSSTPFTINLWEDIYLAHTQVVNSRILSMLGISKRIHARSTVIKPISQIEMDRFLKANHLNITTKVKYKYGMFYKDELVAVIAFGRSCPIQSDGKTYKSHELIRFCSLLNYTVVGGLSKFIHHFVKNVKPEHIMTYVDREWSMGKSYLKLGFNIDGYTPPQVFWLSPDNCVRNYSAELLKTRTSEQLRNEGWKSLENLGNIKLVKFY